MDEPFKPIRVFIIEDNIVLKSVLAGFLKNEDDIEVVGEANTGQGGIILLGDIVPDVVLIKASVEGGMLLKDTIKQILTLTPDAKIIICTDAPDSDTIPEMTEYGRHDFIQKPYKKPQVLRAIRRAAPAAEGR